MDLKVGEEGLGGVTRGYWDDSEDAGENVG